ncbi:hypothetical protein [Hymenobacter wooponensis]|uniref:DUF3300 domain-containing protein n=1 Tax=Hymenobacter wooponensis TaxID=1525360 RepID=A0A4Z0MF15_9BACT|nr:hypothetical protein [Hymenobacter wooponensis]TGD77815.1 hypothetical protein EU557_21205 [Hymenobacter wooponensis]
MIKALLTAAGLTVAGLALGTTSAQAQININIGTPAPRYVVVEKAHPVKARHPKYKKGGVLLVPAGPVYYAPSGNNGRGHGRGKGRH